jgi:hypothetical protein
VLGKKMGAAGSTAVAVGGATKVGVDTVTNVRDVYGDQIADTWDKVDDWQERHGLGGGYGAYYQAQRAKHWVQGKEYVPDKSMSAETQFKGWLRKDKENKLYQLEQQLRGAEANYQELKKGVQDTKNALNEAGKMGRDMDMAQLRSKLAEQQKRLEEKAEEKKKIEEEKANIQ